MHNISNKDSEQSSVHSISNCLNSFPSWWNPSGSHMPPSSYSKNIYMKTNTIAKNVNQIKQLVHHLPDQDSSSTQSTGQSNQDMSAPSGMGRGDNNNYEKRVEGHIKPVLSLGAPDDVFSPPKIDYSPSVACIPYHYADPYFGVLASYGSHAIIHPQMMGLIPPGRVPLPPQPSGEEPIYVNPKQYNGILRRRQLRAKQEAQNKLIKGRKPYLHESRHIHALKRERGSGGRFLNTKKSQQELIPATTTANVQGTSLLQLDSDGRGILSSSEILRSENGTMTTSATPTCSEVTTVSDYRGSFRHQDHHHLSFSADFHTFVTGSSMACNGSHHRVNVTR